jgi:hypothetical protein
VPKNRKSGDLTLLGRLGAYSQHAKYDVVETTRAARAAHDKKFVDQVDPDRTLAPAERDRRVTAARKAHFTRLALLSAEARRRNSVASMDSSAVDGEGGR